VLREVYFMDKTNKSNLILYNHILMKYKNMSKFAKIANVSQEELNLLLLKDNIIASMNIGFRIFNSLNIDPANFLLNGEISEIDTAPSHRENSPDDFRDSYMRLSEDEKTAVKNFIQGILHGD